MNYNKDSVKNAAELLLQGAAMLQIACPNCRDPIYLLKDSSMFCATCNLPVVDKRGVQSRKEERMTTPNSVNDDNSISLKIDQLKSKLVNETDPDEITKIATAIKSLQDIL